MVDKINTLLIGSNDDIVIDSLSHVIQSLSLMYKCSESQFVIACMDSMTKIVNFKEKHKDIKIYKFSMENLQKVMDYMDYCILYKDNKSSDLVENVRKLAKSKNIPFIVELI